MTTLARLREVVGAHLPVAMALPPEFRPAAVLVPVLDAPLRLILTRRPDAMPTHPGQIAFPGGRRDEGDASPAACALREADEELGIPEHAVELLGQLDDFATPSRYVVTPVVGLVQPGLVLRPSPREVAEVFEVPLAALAEPGVFKDMGEREFLGVRQRLSAFLVGERNIWGITARVIQQLLALLNAA